MGSNGRELTAPGMGGGLVVFVLQHGRQARPLHVPQDGHQPLVRRISPQNFDTRPSTIYNKPPLCHPPTLFEPRGILVTYTKTILRAVLATLAFMATGVCWAAEDGEAPAKADFLKPRAFSWQSLGEPESLFWPGYFWGYGGRWNAAEFRRQLEDMVAHDARSICVIPNGEFDPQYTMDPKKLDYLSPKFFERVKYAVDQAARLGMNYWFYDEPGFPSGQAGGQVVSYNPQAIGHRLAYDGHGKWTPCDAARVDYLDPKATGTFIKITHDRYAKAVGSHFGKTIKLIFTDEPSFQRVHPGGDLPWTAGAADIFRNWFGYPVMDKLDAFQTANTAALSPAQKKVRVDLYDFWTRRFRDAYFRPLRDWARQHDLAFGGHLDGDDMTFGIIIEGLGHVLRPLRCMDVPGVDVIERQLFPGKPNHHFPKYASSAAHQNGTALVLTESFGVYGTGLTPAQKKWLIDYQFVRGQTILVSCAGGPGEQLWDVSPHFHRYVARLGYVLACGRPDIETALYYPARDIWASGDADDPALLGHDALARSLLRRQCDFDLVDEDGLTDPSTHVADGRLVVGAMRYRTIVVRSGPLDDAQVQCSSRRSKRRVVESFTPTIWTTSTLPWPGSSRPCRLIRLSLTSALRCDVGRAAGRPFSSTRARRRIAARPRSIWATSCAKSIPPRAWCGPWPRLAHPAAG